MMSVRHLLTLSVLLLTGQLSGQSATAADTVSPIYPVITRLDAARSAGEPPFAGLTESQRGELYRFIDRVLRDSLLNRGIADKVYRVSDGYAAGNREPARIGLLIELGRYEEADSLLTAYTKDLGETIAGSLTEAALLGYRLEIGAKTGDPVAGEDLQRTEVLLQQRTLPSWERAQLSILIGQYLAATASTYSATVYLKSGVALFREAGGEQTEAFRRALFFLAKLQEELGQDAASQENFARARELSLAARALETTELERDLEVLRAAAEASPDFNASTESGQAPEQENWFFYYAIAAVLLAGLLLVLVRSRAGQGEKREQEQSSEAATADLKEVLYNVHANVSGRLRSSGTVAKDRNIKDVIRSGLKELPGRDDQPAGIGATVNGRDYVAGLLQRIRTSAAWPGPNVGTDLLIADQEIAADDALLIGLLVSNLLTAVKPEGGSKNPWIRIRHYRRESAGHLIISDEGHGLPHSDGSITQVVEVLAQELRGTVHWQRRKAYNALILRYGR